MSRQRARTRAEREQQAAAAAAAGARQRAREATERERRERRALAWRKVRLWRHGPGYRRHKEGIAALVSLALVACVVTYLLTSSFESVLAVLLILLIATPVLVMLTFDRRHR